MAREPITLFSARGDPRQVHDLLLTLVPDAAVEGVPDDWSAITVTTDDGQVLRFHHDRDYYAGPDWPKQKAGMQGYFSRFPLGDREAQTMAVIGTFGFSLGTAFEPDYDPAGDERLVILGRVAEAVDGVLFSPSALRDPWGRVLVSATGQVDEEAEWPAVGQLAPAVGFGEGPAIAEDEWEPAPPSPERVARRAVATLILTARAVLERDRAHPNTLPNWERLKEWAGELGIDPEFEPWERDALATRPGSLDPQTAVNAMWRIEGLTVLAWALGRYELLPYDQISDVDGVWDAIGFFDTAKVRQLLDAPTRRPAAEIDAFRKQMLAYHWRLREHTVRPRVMDVRAFAQECWFGSFDVSAFRLIDDDLALGGHRIDQAPPDVLATCMSIAVERHVAANWLCWGPEIYSETDQST